MGCKGTDLEACSRSSDGGGELERVEGEALRDQTGEGRGVSR